VFYAE